MKRIVSASLIVLAVLASAQLIRLAIHPPAAVARIHADLSRFPLHQARKVELHFTGEMQEQLTPREQLDQARDWLLLTVLSGIRLPGNSLREVTYDMPPVRYAQLEKVAGFDYGASRAKVLPGGEVVALVPANDAGRSDYLTDIADQVRKETGQIPQTIEVFEYTCDLKSNEASLVRSDPLNGASLFRPESGYHERTLSSLKDLESLLAEIDDITYSELKGGQVVVGGRRMQTYRRVGIGTEEIAAVWMAQTHIGAHSEEFKRFEEQKKAEFEQRWSNASDSLLDRNAVKSDAASVREELEQEQKRLGVVDHLGFSLDWGFDFDKAARIVEKIPALLTVLGGQLTPVPSQWGHLDFGVKPDVLGELTSIGDPRVLRAVDELKQRRTSALYELLNAIEPKDVAQAILEVLHHEAGIQYARYDGDLKGTKAGMVLFYTDLLAKLWSFNFDESTPTDKIVDFVAATKRPVSPVFKKEIDEQDYTRLWFGPQNKGFQLGPGRRSMLLARNATRLYSASSNSLKPDQETPATALTGPFLDWWDGHFEEVARFEPQYYRLNEIMKWSLVFGWLDQQQALAKLDWLNAVPVTRDNRFPDWVLQHPELRFRAWNKIKFYRPAAFGYDTEVLALLYSPAFRIFGNPKEVIYGGISLADRELIATREALSEEVSLAARRSNLKYGEVGTNTFKTLEDTEYTFANNADRFEMLAKAKPDLKIVGRDLRMTSLELHQNIEPVLTGARFDTAIGETRLGSLAIRGDADVFRVGWASRDMDVAQSVGRAVSTAENPESTLLADGRVTAAIHGNGNEYMVKLDGVDRWLKLRTQGPGELESGWESSVATASDRAHPVEMAWISADEMDSQLQNETLVAISRTEGDGTGVLLTRGARAPPGSKTTELYIGGKQVEAQVGPSGDVYVKWRDLPEAVRQRPSLVQTAMERGGRLGDDMIPHPALDRALDEEDFEAAVRELSRDPLHAQLILRAHYSNELNNATRLLAAGKDGEALTHLRSLETLYGPTPEIELRKALVFASNNRPEEAAQALRAVGQNNSSDTSALFEEVNHRLLKAPTDVERENLETVAKVADWQNIRVRQGSADVVTPIQSGDRILLEYRVVGKPEIQAVTGVTDAKQSIIYIPQDDARLAHLDWSVDVDRTINQVISSHSGMVVRLPSTDIAYFRPSRIYLEDTAVSVERTYAPRYSMPVQNGLRSLDTSQCDGTSKKPGCEQEGSVYVVMPLNERSSL